MTAWLVYPVALAASFATTPCVLMLWVGHARIADGNREGSLFVPMLFLFVPLIFGVSVASNLLAVLIDHVAALLVPWLAGGVAPIGAGALVFAGCAWTQRSGPGLRGSAPVSLIPVAVFALVDALILAAGLSLLSGRTTL